MRQLEAFIEVLVGTGWTLEGLTTEDCRDEPFKAQITLSCDGSDPKEAVL